MVFEWACFISYPHAGGDMVKNFAEQLARALENEIGAYFADQPVFMDKQRINAGFDYNHELSKAICKSVCMIVVYVPAYQEKTYCLREFLAMEAIADKRRQLLGPDYKGTHRMIIPFLLRGDPKNLPPKIHGIQYVDFSKFTTATLDITKLPEFTEVIKNIVKEIYRLYEEIRDLNIEDCDSFDVPSEAEAILLWPRSQKRVTFPSV